MTEQVGMLLWELRTARGWTLGQLAQSAGVSKSALSYWEAGKRLPRVAELEATLDALSATSAQRARAFAFIQAPQIGRASCRERLYTSVVARSVARQMKD